MLFIWVIQSVKGVQFLNITPLFVSLACLIAASALLLTFVMHILTSIYASCSTRVIIHFNPIFHSKFRSLIWCTVQQIYYFLIFHYFIIIIIFNHQWSSDHQLLSLVFWNNFKCICCGLFCMIKMFLDI